MKSYAAAALVLLAGSTAGFTTPSSTKSTAQRMSTEEAMTEAKPVVDSSEVSMEEEPVVATTTSALPEMSQSMPFMARSPALDGSLAGDVGFDPLGFAQTTTDLMNYREAEIKHARLAMLAAAGWPLSEVFDKKIANVLGMTAIIDSTDRAPSVLNGGLGKISPLYWIGCLSAAAVIDILQNSRAQSDVEGYFPGNLGFDPLGVYPKDPEGQRWMQTAEIKNGRLAMIAITAFAVQEFVTKSGVVDETPFFFEPITEFFKQNANSGYIL